MDQKKLQDTAMYSTRDYACFKHLKYNRPVDDKRVEGLMISIKEHGFLLPILVSDDMQVADGQHRLAAAQRLGVPVSYIKFNISGDHLPVLIAKLNSLSQNWKLVNYYEMWKELGRETYNWIGDVIEKYDMTFVNIYKLFAQSHSKLVKKFKDGTIEFTATQRAHIEKLASYFYDLSNYDNKFYSFGLVFRNAVLAVVTHRDYDHERMLRKLKGDAGRLLGCVNKIDFILQLEEVYNHGERNPIDFIKSKSKRAGKIKIKESKR
jgi:hypothetical protein